MRATGNMIKTGLYKSSDDYYHDYYYVIKDNDDGSWECQWTETENTCNLFEETMKNWTPISREEEIKLRLKGLI